jgi:hypothetical protein
MNRYENGKIYKIVCNKTGLVYIGSTCLTLCKRLYKHKQHYKEWLNKKYCYVSSFKIIENNDYDIILIEEYPCDNKMLLRQRERYWIDNIDCVNIVKSFVSIEEKKENNKIYNDNNKDIIKEKKKEYYENNKDIINEKNKEWYNNNKDIISEKNKEKIHCECGSIIRKNNLSRHLKSIKHQDYLKNKC